MQFLYILGLFVLNCSLKYLSAQAMSFEVSGNFAIDFKRIRIKPKLVGFKRQK